MTSAAGIADGAGERARNYHASVRAVAGIYVQAFVVGTATDDGNGVAPAAGGDLVIATHVVPEQHAQHVVAIAQINCWRAGDDVCRRYGVVAVAGSQGVLAIDRQLVD